MIDNFRRAMKDVYGVRKKVIIFMTFLKAMTFFLFLYLIASLFNFYKSIVFLFAVVYFFYELYKELKSVSLTGVERKNPFLNEILRTAADTVKMDENPIVSALRDQVMEGLRKVKVSSFIDSNKLTSFLLVICALAAINMVIAVIGIQIFDTKGFIGGIDFNLEDNLLDDVSESLLDAGVKLDDINDDNILEDLNDQLNRREQLNVDELPEDIFKSGEKGLDQLFSKKKRIYIRNYFNKVQ